MDGGAKGTREKIVFVSLGRFYFFRTLNLIRVSAEIGGGYGEGLLSNGGIQSFTYGGGGWGCEKINSVLRERVGRGVEVQVAT